MWRIRFQKMNDYAWPWLAILERQYEDGSGDWQEIDAWGGDTKAEAKAVLVQENRIARRVAGLTR